MPQTPSQQSRVQMKGRLGPACILPTAAWHAPYFRAATAGPTRSRASHAGARLWLPQLSLYTHSISLNRRAGY